MVKQLILGFTAKNSDPIPVYAGKSSAEAEAAKLRFPQCATFEHFNNISGVVKRNPNFQPVPGPAVEDPIVQDQSEDEPTEQTITTDPEPAKPAHKAKK